MTGGGGGPGIDGNELGVWPSEELAQTVSTGGASGGSLGSFSEEWGAEECGAED